LSKAATESTQQQTSKFALNKKLPSSRVSGHSLSMQPIVIVLF
jgi:hypothetical protein